MKIHTIIDMMDKVATSLHTYIKTLSSLLSQTLLLFNSLMLLALQLKEKLCLT